jgi:hypothetical protein
MIEILAFQSTRGRVTQLMLRTDTPEEPEAVTWREEDGSEVMHGRTAIPTVGATSIAYGEDLPFAMSVTVGYFTWGVDPAAPGTESSSGSLLS